MAGDNGNMDKIVRQADGSWTARAGEESENFQTARAAKSWMLDHGLIENWHQIPEDQNGNLIPHEEYQRLDRETLEAEKTGTGSILQIEDLATKVFHQTDLLDPDHERVAGYIEKGLLVSDWISDFHLTLLEHRISLSETDRVLQTLKAEGWIGDAENDDLLFVMLYDVQKDYREQVMHLFVDENMRSLGAAEQEAMDRIRFIDEQALQPRD